MMEDWLVRPSEAITSSTLGMAATVLGSFAGCAMIGLAVANMVLTRRVALNLPVIAQGVAMVVPRTLVSVHRQLRSQPRYPPGAAYTVRVVNGYALAYKGENISHYLKYVRSPVCELEPLTMETYIPDVKATKETAAMMMLSRKNPEATRRVAQARCLRDGLSEIAVENTVAAAEAMVMRMEPKNEVVPHGTCLPNPVTPASLCALGGLTVGAIQQVPWSTFMKMPKLPSITLAIPATVWEMLRDTADRATQDKFLNYIQSYGQTGTRERRCWGTPLLMGPSCAPVQPTPTMP